jgi:hypothetical protein
MADMLLSAPRCRNCRWWRTRFRLFAQIGQFDHLVLALGSGKGGVGPFATLGLGDVKLSFEEKVYTQFATAQPALAFLNPTIVSPSFRLYPLRRPCKAR